MDLNANPLPGGATQVPPRRPVGLLAVRVVDATRGRVSEPTDLLVEDGLIAAVGAGVVGDGVTIIARSGFIAPGLIDMHTHLVWDGGVDPVGTWRAATPDDWRRTAERNARAALRAGITTVRDLGGPRELVGWRPRPGPDVVAAGPPVTRPGGHLWPFGGEAADAAAAAAVVERGAAAGARVVKVVLSGGGLTPGTDPSRTELPAAVARAAVRAARVAGLRVAAHCHATSAIALALEIGVDTVEHGSCVGPDARPAFDEALARRLADAGIAVCATAAGALRTAARYRQAATVPEHDRAAIERLEARAAFVARWAEAGVMLVAGTDAGVIQTPFDVLSEELEASVAAGLSPAAALRSATAAAADALGLPDRGRVAPGLRADLLVLDGDPTRDVGAVRTPRLVVAGGAVVS
jgi:imidazolonepropionase-like amidohydrolase